MPPTEFDLASMHRLARKAGVEKLDDDAAATLSAILENIGLVIAKQANEFARHTGRKTIKASDVKLATKRVLRAY